MSSPIKRTTAAMADQRRWCASAGVRAIRARSVVGRDLKRPSGAGTATWRVVS